MQQPGRVPREPRRILIVSADMGAGHHATGRALEEAARRLWPDCQVRWVDTLEAMGRVVGPLFRRIYVDSVEQSPWLYEYFYRAVWRYRWFAESSKAVIGAWAGRALARHIDDARPDLILSTYPMGSTGLAWLRRHRGLDVPTGAWVSDFNPHPSWVHPEIDVNLVMHDVAVPVATAGVPGATVAVSALPVERRFHPGDPAAARGALDLPADGPLAVISCGSLGFGDSADTVLELLDAAPDLRVIVVAGRNDALRGELCTRFASEPRVQILGWVGDMPTLLQAADLVVTNAGGATALEALACGTPVIMHRPIAGHGRANAALMARAGLATVCVEPGELAKTVAGLAGDPAALEEMRAAAIRHATERDLADGLRDLAHRRPAVARPLTAEDALFGYAGTEEVPQELGAILVFEPGEDGSHIGPAEAQALLNGVPGVHGRLRRDRPWRRIRWMPDDAVDPATMVDVVRLGDRATPADFAAAVDGFYSVPLPADHPCAAGLLVHGLPGGRSALLTKLHHALGDGVTVLRGMLSATDIASHAWATPLHRQVARGRLRDAVRGKDFRLIARGLLVLARAGSAPAEPRSPGRTGRGRHYELARIPQDTLRAAAQASGLTVGELIPASFAEAVHRVGAADPERSPEVRLMVPWSVRDMTSTHATGNRTGALSLDIPVGPMPRARRFDTVRSRLRHHIGHGMPQAAQAVVRAMGVLPAPLHAVAARAAYNSRWFSVLGSMIPGPRAPVRVHGYPLVEAYPVLPLAPGVDLAWGTLTWGRDTSLGITAAGDWADRAALLAREWQAVLAESAGDAS